MKRIKDFSKVIGIVGRGGRYYPSNEKSESKTILLLQDYFLHPIKPSEINFDRNGLESFRVFAKERGFQVVVIERGLNR